MEENEVRDDMLDDDMWDDMWDDENESVQETGEAEAEDAEAEDAEAEEAPASEEAETEFGGGDPTSEGTAEAEAEAEAPAQPQFTKEQLAAMDAEMKRREDAMVAAQFGHMVNPYTGNKVTTKAELDAYNRAFQEEERRNRMQEMGIDEKMLNELINDHPAIRRANELIREQERAQANAFAKKEFEKLQQDFPDCGLESAADLFQTAAGREALEFWKTSQMSLSQAYAATHLKEIMAKKSRAVKQKVMNEVNSKKHLQTPKGSTAEDTIPQQDLEGLRIFFPNETDAQLIARWKKNN